MLFLIKVHKIFAVPPTKKVTTNVRWKGRNCSPVLHRRSWNPEYCKGSWL